MALVLAIDLGTTNLKAGIINSSGKVLALAKHANTILSEEPGTAAHNPHVLKESILSVCRTVLATVDRQQVTAIVTATYHFGVMLQGENGAPLTHMTLLTDRRAERSFEAFKDSFADIPLYENTGCPLLVQYPLPRLYYFHTYQPQLLVNTKKVYDSKSFLFEWLTGLFVTDASIASASQLFNSKDYCWDETILSRLSLTPDQFPFVEDGTTFSAPLQKEIAMELGLQDDVVVALGLYDGAALGASLAGLEPHVGVVNIGTTAMFRAIHEQPIIDKDASPKIQAYALRQHCYFNGGAINNAALPLNWLQDIFKAAYTNNADSNTASHLPPLFSLPYLTGERYCGAGPYASGVFFGLRPQHSATDMARAVMEGVAYTMRSLYEALAENQITINQLKMGGGGVHIPHWPQLFADVLGLPVEIPMVEEMALVGNAIIAYVALGVFSNIAQGQKNMTTAGKLIQPIAAHQHNHEKRYRFFKQLRQSMDVLYLEHGTTDWHA